MERQRLTYLLEQYSNDIATPDELEELRRYIDVEENGEEFTSLLADFMPQHKNPPLDFAPYEELPQKALQIDKADRSARQVGKPIHRVYFLRKWGWAAAIIVVLGAAAYLWTTSKKTEQPLANGNKSVQTDIPPGSQRAVLTLADGTEIILDSAANGNLAQQGNAQIVKLANGQIAYNLMGLPEGDGMINTMSTPYGGQYQLTLPDGTKVWLNAASSITYPSVFAGKGRNVKIKGEAYFEVAKSKDQPFIVDMDGGSSIQVLGTSFNINSYENEAGIKATLVDGSVKIFNGDDGRPQFAVLKPGQQATVGNTAVITVLSNTDIPKVLAWKNGWFNFNGANLYDVMRQLERWYDIKVQYEGHIPELRFKGEIDRGISLFGILSFFALDSRIKTRLDGRTLIISGN